MSHWVYLSVAIVAEVVGTLFLKSSDGFSKVIPSVIVVVSYALAFYLLSISLKSISVGIAYAVWAGAGVALIAVAGFIFFGQKLDMAAILGMVLIISGVVIINVFSASADHGGG
ncbi:SMR family transporter [Microbulbifer sp. YPW1]|uniref:SMR family transporter n=1 Tax=Microbulbifer sp. YPW1 TaxID=2745199 RepID=UPI00159AC9AD|nr:SMR family transporter [Microbulbifer sp. YPW1]QKX18423.1 QacE family quaternary ammonium compound efflux SMR transporter [Microbulbifer sp. YPW1]